MGNLAGLPDDNHCVTCAECREALSAQLDGEHTAVPLGALDQHLALCAQCREFADGAARITRLARTGIADAGPDLVDAVLAAAPPPRVITLTRVARALLAVLAVGQMGLSLGSLLAVSQAGAAVHAGMSVAGATMAHMSHETAAWNLAIGAGFLWVAMQSSTRSAGLVPLLGAFVGVLTLLSAVDLVAGRVEVVRLLSHSLIVLGLALVVLLDRRRRSGGGSTPGTRWGYGQLPHTRDDAAGLSRTGEDNGPPGLRPTARHRAA